MTVFGERGFRLLTNLIWVYFAACALQERKNISYLRIVGVIELLLMPLHFEESDLNAL